MTDTAGAGVGHIPITEMVMLEAALLPSFVTDDDSFFAPAVAIPSLSLLPAQRPFSSQTRLALSLVKARTKRSCPGRPRH